jgi:hypothetical protein
MFIAFYIYIIEYNHRLFFFTLSLNFNIPLKYTSRSFQLIFVGQTRNNFDIYAWGTFF